MSLDLQAIKAACEKFPDVDAWFPREIRAFNEWLPALVEQLEWCDKRFKWYQSRVEALEAALREIADHSAAIDPASSDPIPVSVTDERWKGYRRGVWEMGDISRRALEGGEGA